jgi:pyruvate-formate lyase-activating enzyme
MGAGPARDLDRRRGGRAHDVVRVSAVGLAYTDARGRVFFDERHAPLADGGIARAARADELIPLPEGAVVTMLPGRTPRLAGGRTVPRRTALGVLLPAGFTRTLLPAYDARPGAPQLPLFGYTFAGVVDDALVVAAMRTDESEDWQPRHFADGELEAIVAGRLAVDPRNRTLAQLAVCARSYGCFTAQNVFLERGEAAIPVAPKCNAACVGCISEQDDGSAIPSPQTRIAFEPDVEDLARIGIHHLERVAGGIVSFGQGCEGEPLLRSIAIAGAIERIRAQRSNGTLNCNTNGSLPAALRRLIDAGLQAVRISLNSFRPEVYAAYYRPAGYTLDDVVESIATAVAAGLRVSLNLLTHPGVTDERAEVEAMEAVLRAHPVALVQTRTLNIDPDVYFARVGRPVEPIGMREALGRIQALGIAVGNFTHTH